MDQEKSRKDGLWPIVLTSFVTFIATFVLIYGLKYLNPQFAIKFNQNVVNYTNIKKFEDVKKLIKENFYEEVKEDELLEGAISGMANSLKDPYTTYFSSKEMKDFKEKSSGSYAGVGFSVRAEDGLLTVKETFDDSPAKKAGIVPGDKVVKVDGTDVTGIKSEEVVVSMIKGPEGTAVKLNIYRPSENKFIDFDLKRKIIKVENIKSEVLPGDIGYIRLMMFDNDMGSYFNNHLERLIVQNIKALVIDVRDNPGGSYFEVIKICDTLLPEGVVVYTQDKNGVKERRFSDPGEVKLPIVLLVNENSASASEILAGALKDFKKGTLVGVKTYGKGVVQELKEFQDGSGLKLTIARYFTPSGVSIEKIGIQPDVEVLATEKYKNFPVSQIPRAEDVQLKKAVEIAKDKIAGR